MCDRSLALIVVIPRTKSRVLPLHTAIARTLLLLDMKRQKMATQHMCIVAIGVTILPPYSRGKRRPPQRHLFFLRFPWLSNVSLNTPGPKSTSLDCAELTGTRLRPPSCNRLLPASPIMTTSAMSLSFTVEPNRFSVAEKTS